jgi:hypothetical protein
MKARSSALEHYSSIFTYFMSIQYRDHLTSSCNEELLSVQAITTPRAMGTPTELRFEFQLGFNLERLNAQANAFSLEFRSNPHFVKALDSCISLQINERDQAVANCYKYSYYKAAKIIDNLRENGYNYLGNIPSNSYLFYGHKYLVYSYLNYNLHVQSCTQNMNLYISRILSTDENFCDDFQNDPFYETIVSELYPGGIYNSTFERILQTMESIPEIQCGPVHDNFDIDMSGYKVPLGNMCYRNNTGLFTSAETIGTVRTLESLTDHISKYWNIANFVYCTSVPDFSDNTTSNPYSYVESDRLSPYTLFAQIESITGIRCGDKYSTYGITYPYTNRPSDPRGTFSPGTIPSPSNGNGYSPKGSSPKGNGPAPNKRNNNKPGNRKTKLNIISLTGRALENFVSASGKALSSDEARGFIYSLGETFIDGRLKERQIKRIINDAKRNKFVFEDSNIRSNLGIVGSDNNRRTIAIEDVPD